jgi:predicted GNAT family N-acyltransferase
LIAISQITYGSDAYKDFVLLRYKILRAPLGLEFSEQDLANENQEILLAAFENEKMVGTCILREVSTSSFKLRQMCVDNDIQHKGVGSVLLKFVEEIAKKNDKSKIELHARAVAVEFYAKHGYKIQGNIFEEVGIPHFKMEKFLMKA